MKTPFFLLCCFLTFWIPIHSTAQERVMYKSKSAYIIDRASNDLLEKLEGNFRLNLSADGFKLDSGDSVSDFKIVKQQTSEVGSLIYELDKGHYVVVNENLRIILFGEWGSPYSIKFDLDEKTDLSTNQTHRFERNTTSDDFQTAQSYFITGNTEQAIVYFKKSALAGNRKAMEILYQLYLLDEEYGPNYEEALKWLEMAYDPKDYSAAYLMGYAHHEAKNIEKAIYWYKEAYNLHNHKEAQLELGACHLIIGDYKEAMKWLKKADKNNLAGASLLISKMYEQGLGVEKSRVEARKWLERSASLGSRPAKEALKNF